MQTLVHSVEECEGCFNLCVCAHTHVAQSFSCCFVDINSQSESTIYDVKPTKHFVSYNAASNFSLTVLQMVCFLTDYNRHGKQNFLHLFLHLG